MPPESTQKTRLNSWKEVAAFFGKTERTVMRWESERGMPVHRPPGEAGSSVYADIAELETWLRGPAAATTPKVFASATEEPQPDIATTEAVPPPLVAPSRWTVVAFGMGIAMSLGLAVAVMRAFSQASVPPPPAAKELYIKGLQDWAERNPEALNRGIEEFSEAIRIDRDYAEAYVGLANSYILLREFSLMPSAQAYGLAKAAAVHAIALRPGLAGAHAAYGFTLLYGDWRFAEGLTQFERALQLEPDNSGLQHWYATALMAVGQHGAALYHIERALELAPGAREIKADHGLILFSQGRYDEARVLLTRLAIDNPDFLSPHTYLTCLALATGDNGMYLREEAVRVRLQRDTRGSIILRALQAGYETEGDAGMLRALIEARLAALADGTGGASSVARAYAAAGNKQQTLKYLSLALDRRDENAFADVNNSMYRTLLGDAALAPLRARLALPND